MLRMAIVRTGSWLLLCLLLVVGCGPKQYKMLIGVTRETLVVGASAKGDIGLMQVNYATDTWRRHTLKSVACDDGACSGTILPPEVKDGYSSDFLVVPLRAGDLTVHLRVETDDGDDVEDTATIHAGDVAAVLLGRNVGEARKEGDAILLGSGIGFRVGAVDAHGAALSPDGGATTMSISSAALAGGPSSDVIVTNIWDAFDLKAVALGDAIVTAHVGHASRSRSVHVVSPADVTRITLHRLLDPRPSLDEGPGYDAHELADDWLATGERQRSLDVVPVSHLADGSVALGGADGCTLVGTATDVAVLGTVGDQNQAISIDGRGDGQATIVCTIGSATAQATVTMMDLTASYDP